MHIRVHSLLMKTPTTAYPIPLRPLSPSDKRRQAAYAPFSSPSLPANVAKRPTAPSVWTRPLGGAR